MNPTGDTAPRTARLLAALQQATDRLEALERAAHEPIAVIGMGCRFPGGIDDPESLWQLLRTGGDAVGEIPAERFDGQRLYDPHPDAAGRISTRHGAFVEGVDRFDARFFGIAPREAARLDPQHRLLLEVGWEALERAGQAPENLEGTATGVFVGIGQNDYACRRLTAGDLEAIEAYDGTGNGFCFAAGRLSYHLGLQGPCLAVDTACSSSAVAAHLAMQSLNGRECDLALVGGVQLILSPEIYVFLSRTQALSPDGRSKAFAADADGYGRGEGCGVVVLKRLADALADGDDVAAVLLGSAVNHDGKSSGLTVPNRAAQEQVLRRALERAGVEPSRVGLVEAHGTGTELGDPIELRALDAVFGAQRDTPLALGSIKANLGHLEAAAGIASLMKVVLALQHRAIPPQPHCHEPSRQVDWQQVRLSVPQDLTDWPPGPEGRVAGVSSFGLSGTNAHLLVGEAPPAAAAAAPEASAPRHEVLALSAATAPALHTQIQRYVDRLQAPDTTLADVCFSATTGRSHFPHRLATVAATPEEMARQLAAAAADDRGVHVDGTAPPPVFLFTGQGAQYPDMGRALYAREPVVRRIIDQASALLHEELGRPLTEILFPDGGDPRRIHQTRYTQPALFCLEYAVARLWMHWGIEPTAVLGHSIGEYVAACLAGVFSLDDGLRLLAARARLMDAAPGDGAMHAVQADEPTVRAALRGASEVTIAAVNAPRQVVISGHRGAIEPIVATLRAEGIRTVPLEVSHAFHSPLMAPVVDDFRRVAERVTYHPPQLRLVANLTGEPIGDDIAGADYWCRQIVGTVRFADGIEGLYDAGYRLFLEVGPKPSLLGMARTTLGTGRPITCIPSLRPSGDARRTLMAGVAQLYHLGHALRWQAIYPATHHRRVPLPTYPFERRRHWLEAPTRDAGNGQRRDLRRTRIPRLGQTVFETAIDPHDPGYLDDHRIHEAIVVPGAYYLALALAVAAHEAPTNGLREVEFHRPLVIDGDDPVTVQLLLADEAEGDGTPGHRGFEVVSFATDGTDRLHASGRLDADRGAGPRAMPGAASEEAPGTAVDLYAHLGLGGIDLGRRFRWIETCHRRGDRVDGVLRRPDALDAAPMPVHPTLLDACLQSLAAFAPADGTARVPVSVARVSLWAPLDGERYACQARLARKIHQPSAAAPHLPESTASEADFAPRQTASMPASRRSASSLDLQASTTPRDEVAEFSGLDAEPTHGMEGSVRLFDPTGRPMLEMDGVVGRPLPAAVLVPEDHAPLDRHVLHIDWTRADPEGEAADIGGAWLLVDGAMAAQPDAETDLLRGLAAHLEAHGASSTRIDGARLDAEAFIDTLERWLTSGTPRGIVLPVATRASNDLGRRADAAAAPLALALALVQALIRHATTNGRSAPTLWIVTHDAQPIDGATDRLDPDAAALWGWIRCLAWEHPSLDCRLIDLEAQAPETSLGALLAELLTTDGERLVGWRDGQRHVARLVRHDPTVQAGRVALGAYGSFDHLDRVAAPIAAPEVGEVTVAVEATGLNFRDVLQVLGVLRQQAEAAGFASPDEIPFGFDLAGRVLAVGDGVDGFAIGDPVVGLVPGALASTVNARAELLAPRPERLSAEDAATLPLVFVTVEQALERAKALAPGRRVLVHAAAGGVGMAAVQRARQAGAEVFATAHPSKWDAVRALGVEHVASSRDAQFASWVAEITQGAGVDVVLHSLGDDLAEASLDTLGNGGRFVELGRMGTWDAEAIRRQRPDVEHIFIDLVDDVRHRPATVGTLLRTIVERVAAGTLQPLPTDVFAASAYRRAFRHLARAAHIGKVVVSRRGLRDAVVGAIPTDGPQLITGGHGALGLALAEWLASQGARHLVLAARREASPQVATRIAALAERGVHVVSRVVDVTDAQQVARLVGALATDDPPLRGVFHLAGVLDDGPVETQDPLRLQAVLAPKVEGAWHLHHATQDLDLDAFVLFSSAASVLGSPGQSSYAAANAVLDTLAHRRHGLGLPATSINWGAFDAGMATAVPTEHRRRQAAAGMQPIDPTAAFTWLARTPGDAAQLTVLPADWSRLHAHLPSPLQPLARRVAPARADSGRASAFARAFADAPAEARRGLLIKQLRMLVATVLGLPAHEVEERQPLFDLGLDSLTAVELRNRLAADLGRSLRTTVIFDYPTIDALAGHLVEAAEPASPPRELPDNQDVDALLEQLEQQSDASIQRALETSQPQGGAP